MKLILVHGAWHGPWCWRSVIPHLEAAGHQVATPDLPVTARGMAEWRDIVLAEVADGPAVLVGHSRGGAVIAAAAEAAPDKIARLIFLSGFLLKKGQSVLAAAQEDILLPVAMDQEARRCTLRGPGIEEQFYAGCTREDRAFALEHLRPEPMFGLVTPARVTAERFGIVPRDYVECTQDQVISLAAQRRMQAAWPVQRVRAIECGHSPFFACPAELAGILAQLA